VTHDQVEAMTMADRIAVLNRGHILQMGAPSEIYNQPANTFVASFVGSPAINLFEAVLTGTRLVVIGGRFEQDIGKQALDRIKGYQGEVRFGIRPEDLEITKVKKNGYSAAIIYNIENTGMEKIVTLKLEDYIFKAVTTADFEAEMNDEVYVQCRPNKLHFFDRETHQNLV